MEQSDAFRRPISYGEIRAADFDALILTGGHAPGMRVYLGSGVLQSAVADFFAQTKPVGAICHGVLLAARSSHHPGKSVLYGKKTTALTKQMELIAWRLTHRYLGDYYRTYPTTVEDEVRSSLARPEDFIRGPLAAAPRFGGATSRGIHGARRRLLIGTVAGRRTSLCRRTRRDDWLMAVLVVHRASLRQRDVPTILRNRRGRGTAPFNGSAS